MNIPGLLIEYIISGAIAISWIIILFVTYTDVGPLIQRHATVFALIGIPFAYILGMLIDMMVYPFVKGRKHRIRGRVFDSVELEQLLSPAAKTRLDKPITELLTTLFPTKHFTDNLVIDLQLRGFTELVKEVNWRSSRDRIARGMIFNALALTISITLLIDSLSVYRSAMVIAVGLVLAVLMTALFVRIWLNFEKLSHRFQVLAFLKLYETNAPTPE